MTTQNETVTFQYRFEFKNGIEKNFVIELDSHTLNLIRKTKHTPPDWTKSEGLSCKRFCNFDKHYCDIAVNIQEVIEFFSDTPSYEIVKVTVEVNNRTYFKETSLQDGVGSLMGIIMVTCGCPVLAKLKPLVRFHLPFASIEETEFRVLSMYLLSQYLRKRKGLEPDWEMKELKKLYEEIQEINISIAQRISDVEEKDASINAVVILHNFASSIVLDLDEDNLSSIENLFKEWLQKPNS